MPRGTFTTAKWSNRTGSRERTLAIPCETCGKIVNRYPSTVKKLTFCGFACYGVWCSAHRRGENSATFRGGTVSYRGPNWRDQRAAALARDQHTCQRCGAKTRLQVHHVMPFRCFESYVEANVLANLQTLCVPCRRGRRLPAIDEGGTATASRSPRDLRGVRERVSFEQWKREAMP